MHVVIIGVLEDNYVFVVSRDVSRGMETGVDCSRHGTYSTLLVGQKNVLTFTTNSDECIALERTERTEELL